MAYFKFAEAIRTGRAIDVYNHGNMKRDFTYIDDIVDGIASLLESPPAPYVRRPPHRVYNLGNNRPERLLDMISLLEKAMGKSTLKRLLPMQPGDVVETYADITQSARDFGYQPKTSLADGLKKFVDWHSDYVASKAQ